MVIEIGHYERNTTPTASKISGIKSLGTVEELGMADHRTAKKIFNSEQQKPRTSQ